MTFAEIRQESLLTLGDGEEAAIPLVRMGLPALLNKWDLFALGGKMFTASQVTVGTPVTGGTADAGGIVLTEPSWRISVPTGLTIFPHRFNISLATAAGTINEIALVSCTSATTSGGTAIVTALNLRQDAPSTSSVTILSGTTTPIVEGALTNVRIHYQASYPAALAAHNPAVTINVVWNDLRPLVGPCNLMLFTGGSTAPTFVATLEWAELPTTAVKAG